MNLHVHIFLGAFFCCLSLQGFSQELTFCERVNDKGVPTHPGHVFTVGHAGGFLNMLVTLPKEVNSDFVTYDLFLLTEGNAEVFENTIRHPVKPGYTWFREEITFHKTGVYNVYVYDDKDKLLCASRVAIKVQ